MNPQKDKKVARPHSKEPKSGAPLSKGGKIDPAELDATEERRQPIARNRPEPSEELKKAEAAMESRALKRPVPPGIMLEAAGYDEEHWTSPHSDRDLWTLQLADAFGTRSQAVFITFMRQLEALCDHKIWDDEEHQWRLDEHQFSAAMAMVNTVKPRNEMEAALAAQMVAVHMMQMKLSARAIKYDDDPKTAAIAAKLAKTFTDQLAALQSIKGRSRTTRQSIKVTKETHQHIHYHDHRGDEVIDGESHAPSGADAAAECTALPSPNSEGRVMSKSSRQGTEPVPHARGKEQWRAKG